MTNLDRRNCPIARTLDLIGDRWSLLIIRDLMLEGPRRFSDLEQSVVGASPSILSARQKWLKAQGVVKRRIYSQHPPRAEYLLTGKGQRLGPVLAALHAYGTDVLGPKA